ncbi:MAG: hypothetical protein F9K30_09745 [Dechloromonas sp.]|nr:MAG: hypothetical protein F9K30_09745 [Dechloromonas sp.]
MIHLDTALSQQFVPADLPTAVRSLLGKPLRRAPALAQLAVLGALACLPAERRGRPTALLWQSTSGPRLETLELLDEVCQGSGEPLPFTFLATVPASAAVQLHPFVPGLRTASTLPLESEQAANWHLLLSIAANWLNEGRYEQVLCAHLDHWSDSLNGHWLALSATTSGSAPATLRAATGEAAIQLADTPDFPVAVARWLAEAPGQPLRLHSPAAPGLAVEFART